jgi:hypothetical protein
LLPLQSPTDCWVPCIRKAPLARWPPLFFFISHPVCYNSVSKRYPIHHTFYFFRSLLSGLPVRFSASTSHHQLLRRGREPTPRQTKSLTEPGQTATLSTPEITIPSQADSESAQSCHPSVRRASERAALDPSIVRRSRKGVPKLAGRLTCSCWYVYLLFIQVFSPFALITNPFLFPAAMTLGVLESFLFGAGTAPRTRVRFVDSLMENLDWSPKSREGSAWRPPNVTPNPLSLF